MGIVARPCAASAKVIHNVSHVTQPFKTIHDMTFTALTSDEYLAAFRTRRECCRALLELSREQKQLIESDHYEALIELLQMKQRLVDELVGPPDAPWKQWQQESGRLSVSSRTAGDALLAETEALLRTLLAEEQLGTEELTVRRDASERELAQMSSSHQIDLAYGSMPTAGSRLGLDIDL